MPIVNDAGETSKESLIINRDGEPPARATRLRQAILHRAFSGQLMIEKRVDVITAVATVDP